ncbi:unnamed protein product, partial [Brassica oleracea var. botrytis]
YILSFILLIHILRSLAGALYQRYFRRPFHLRSNVSISRRYHITFLVCKIYSFRCVVMAKVRSFVTC